MLLCADVGNTNIKFALYENDNQLLKMRFFTNAHKTADDFAVDLYTIFQINRIDTDKINGAIISSVVPKITKPLSEAIEKVTEAKPLIIGPGIKTGLDLRIDNPLTLGSDLVAMCVAVKELYPCPAIVIGLGTATTILYMNKNKAYCGGAIAPGVSISLDALTNNGALLPSIDIKAPEKVIGTNTEDCISSGLVYGTACMLDGMIERYQLETDEKCTLIATGGLANSIAKNCKNDIIINDDLILEGLKIIYKKNAK